MPARILMILAGLYLFSSNIQSLKMPLSGRSNWTFMVNGPNDPMSRHENQRVRRENITKKTSPESSQPKRSLYPPTSHEKPYSLCHRNVLNRPHNDEARHYRLRSCSTCPWALARLSREACTQKRDTCLYKEPLGRLIPGIRRLSENSYLMVPGCSH